MAVVSLDAARRVREERESDADRAMIQVRDEIRHVTAKAIFLAQAHGREAQVKALLGRAHAHACLVLAGD